MMLRPVHVPFRSSVLLCAVVLVLGQAYAQGNSKSDPKDALLDTADHWIGRGRSQEACALLEPAAARYTATKDTAHLLGVLRRLSRATYDLGDLGASMRASQRMVDLGLRTKDYYDVGYGLNRLAIVADQVSPPDTVRRMYERALHYFRLSGDSISCAITYDNLGYYPLLEQPRNYALCVKFSERALACLTDTTGEKFHRTAAIIESSLCNYYSWWDKDEEGIKHGLLSVRHAELSNDLPIIIHVTTELAAAYAHKKDNVRALHLLLRSDSLARASSMALNKRRDIPELLSTVYEDMGDFQNALKYFKEREVINEQLRGDATKREMERLERRRLHEGDSLAQVVALHDQAVLNRQELRTERTMRWAALAGIVLVIAGFLVFWDRYRRAQAAKAAILTARHALVVSEAERSVAQARTRIASDVHDELGSDLTKLSMLSSEAVMLSPEQEGPLSGVMERIGHISRTASAALSDIVWAVDPERDSVRDLLQHAHVYAIRMLEGTELISDLRFEAEGEDRQIDPAIKRDIFLLLKEGLNNAIKHAGAKNLRVALETGPDRFRLVVEDDGKGMDVAAMAGSGNGLVNMRERARRLGAQLRITSAVGSGTRVEVEGPLI